MNAATPMHGGESTGAVRPSWAPPGVKFHGGRPVYPSNRKTFPMRLYDREREEGKEGAARLLSSEVIGRVSSWDRSPVKEAEYWRSVGLDWSRHLKAGGKGELPSKTVKRLEARIAQLGEQLRALGFDPSTLPEVAAPTRDADAEDADDDWEYEEDEPEEDLSSEDGGSALARVGPPAPPAKTRTSTRPKRAAAAKKPKTGTSTRPKRAAAAKKPKARTSTRPKRAAAVKARRGASMRRKAGGAR